MKRVGALVVLLALPLFGCGDGDTPISEQHCKELIRTYAQSVADHYGKGREDKADLDRIGRKVLHRSKHLQCPGYTETVTTSD